MFHSEDGLYFQREPDGGVTIIKTSDGKEPTIGNHPGYESNVEFCQTLPPGVWCSAVASVSAGDEINGRWYQAMDFHNEVADRPASIPPRRMAE